MIHGASTGKTKPGSGTNPIWVAGIQTVPGTITAIDQAGSGYYSKQGKAAIAQGQAALANAHANATNAEANLINAKAFASGAGKVGGLDLTTWIIIGGGVLAAAIILMRR